MNKRVLIISPYFPPVNAADTQRVRMSLPYFSQFGWDAEVVAVDPVCTQMPKDELLLQSIPANVRVHHVSALKKKLTSKVGLGSIALRSMLFYKKEVNKILRTAHFDLIYFSTTQFPVCVLGAYWKKRFGIPYIIDMQDPWHSDYYKDKPRNQRPKKYWFSYRLNKYLEPKAMKTVDGLISVSENYITDLKTRYPNIRNIPAETITFGAFEPDFRIALQNKHRFDPILDPIFINIVYIGRGGLDMHKAVSMLFSVFKLGLKKNALFAKIKFWFIGTSYAPPGFGKPTIAPLADQFGITDHVIEVTDRIGYYHTLLTLQQADALFMPGSDDPNYTASKIYPYIYAGKPLLAIFNQESPAIKTLQAFGAPDVLAYDSGDAVAHIRSFLDRVCKKQAEIPEYSVEAIEQYSAISIARKQCVLFDRVTNEKN